MSGEVQVNRQLIEDELEKIYDQHNELVPATVVEVARAEDHPLHSQFEWDNSAAANAYRCAQAAQLIRSVKITVTRDDHRGITDHKVRAWVPASDVGDHRPGYIPMQEIESPVQREMLLRQMRRDTEALRRRYAHLGEFFEVLDEVTGRKLAIEPGPVGAGQAADA